MVSLGKVVATAEQEKSIDRAIWHKGQCDEAVLKTLIADHHKWTGSLRARHILDNWVESRAKFVKVFPNEYRRALGEIAARELSAMGESDAAAKAGDTIAKAKSKSAKSVPAK
jgi:glutamate synthase domain-containing protein 3